MPKYLIHFSVGPVQSFIDQARKTQDMFAGSGLITHLRRKAMAYLKTAFTNSIDFITPYNDDQIDEVLEEEDLRKLQHLNKLECILRTDQEINQIGKALKEGCENEFLRLAEKLLTPNEFPKHKTQISNFIECTFAANEIIDDNYKLAYLEQQELITAIKQSRPLNQYHQGENGKKCSVDKTHSIQVYRLKSGEASVKAAQKLYRKEVDITILNNTENVWVIEPGEGLSAITFVKRKFLNEVHTYPSTAKLAAYNFFENKEIQNTTAFKKFQNILKELGHSNDQLFFKENLNIDYFTKYELFGVNEREAKLKELVEHFNEIAKKANDLSLFSNSYYGVIKFDGDNSNKMLSGIWLKDDSQFLSFHKAYSEAQYHFVKALMDFIQPPIGKVVYSGEDFLIFFNIEKVVEVLSCIYDNYNDKIVNQLKTYLKEEHQEKITYSAGITFAHYKEPLDLVMKHMRKALGDAKQYKNSFTLQFVTGSGNSSQQTLSWPRAKEAKDNLFTPLQELFTALDKKKISPSFINNVEQKDLYSPGGIIPERFAYIFKRTVERAIKKEKDSNNNEEITNIIHKLVNILPEKNKATIINLFNLIEIIYRKSHEQFKAE